MWVGAEIGPNFMADADLELKSPGTSIRYEGASVNTSVVGGLTIGYHFVPEGFLGYSWPKWMKYFQVALDVSFHRLVWGKQTRPATINDNGTTIKTDATLDNINGQMLTVAIPIMACYGFFPDSVAPFGRLIPYVGVGPAFFATWASTSSLGSFLAYDWGLLAEAGVRYMALKNVSLDLSFRYRNPMSAFGFERGNQKIDFDRGSSHLFNALVRASYHF